MPVTRPDIPNDQQLITSQSGGQGGGEYSNARATPEAFGAGVGGAVEKAGEQGVDVVQHYQQMANEAHANDVIANQFAPAAAKLSADFYSKQGKDAVMAEPAYTQSLTNLRGQFLENQNPAVKQILGNYMTKHAAQEVDGAARYAGQQQVKYEDDSHKAFVDTLSNNAVSNYNNPDAVSSAFSQMDGQILKHGIDRGQSDEEISENQRNAKGVTINAMVGRAVAAGDVATANQIYSQNKEVIPGHQQLEIDKMLHGENMRQMGDANAKALLAGQPLPATGVGHSVPEVQATVADAAQKTGIDPNHALTVASIESGFGQNVGKRGDIGQTGKGGDLPTQANNLTTELKKSDDIATNSLGRQSEPWEGYVCYQQGAGGGPALLKASTDDPTARAVDVLRPLYGSNKEALSAIQKNGGNASMTSGQFLDFIKQNYQAHAARAQCAIPHIDATMGQNVAATPTDTGLTPSPVQSPTSSSLSDAILAPTKEGGVATQPGATPMQSLIELDKNYPDALLKATQITNLDQRKATLESLDQIHSAYQQGANAYKTRLVNQAAQIAYDPKFTSMDDPRLTPEMKTAIQTDVPNMWHTMQENADRNANKGTRYFGNVDFSDAKSIASATQLAVAGAAQSGESLNKTMWTTKDAEKFNDQWSALPLQADKDSGGPGKLEVLRAVRDGAGPYAANVFSALKSTYPNAAYAAAIPDDKTAGEILMGDQRIVEDKNKEIPLSKIDAQMQTDGYDKALLPQQYDQVKAAARSIFAARYSSGQNLNDDQIKGVIQSAMGGSQKTTYNGKDLVTPVGVTSSQMDKFLSTVDNNDIVTGMNNAQEWMTGKPSTLEIPRLKGGVTFQSDKTPFTLQTVGAGIYQVMQPNGDPYPANMKGGKMLLKLSPDMIINKKQPVTPDLNIENLGEEAL